MNLITRSTRKHNGHTIMSYRKVLMDKKYPSHHLTVSQTSLFSSTVEF